MNPKEFIEKADINQEKKEAILWDDSTMVVANPGTGKTLLLAYKYVYLLYSFSFHFILLIFWRF